MRVALVYRNFNLGGSLGRDAVLLARSLAEEGVEVHLYGDPTRRSDAADGLVFHDVRPLVRGQSRFARPLERASFAARSTRALRRDRPQYDIVHVSGTDGWEHDVVTVHEVVAAAQRRWADRGGRGYRAARLRAAVSPLTRPEVATGRIIQRLQFRPGRFRRLIAVTDEIRRDLIETCGVPSDRVDVVPYAVDLDAVRTARTAGLRLRFGLRPSDVLLLFIGHEYERKGLADAVSALSALPDHVHLVVVGGGDAAPFLRLAEHLGAAKRIHFAGATEQPERAYTEADLFVLPTWSDPWGMPLIEAMAAGVPIVTTLAAGAASVVADAGAGVVVPTRAPRELAEAIRMLVDDPARRAALGVRGRAAADRFGTESQARAALRVYELARRGRARNAPPVPEMVRGASA
jgi:UDP-glucose:(heptosyl)LPS alpha-1,3-glucosyltransferase